MLLTRDHREASSREGAGCGVEVGLSFPFLTAPPPAVLRGEASLDETLRGTALAEALLRHLPGAAASRVYVGNETCERLLPTPQAIGSWVSSAREGRIALSLVLPPLSQDGLAKAEAAVRALEGVEDSEVVANDWGTVHRLRSRHPGLAIVLGRLTHKMLRDPRLADYFDSPQAPMSARSALCRSGELAPGFRALMERYGIGRREIDPFLQPLEEDEWEGRGERLSVHLPYQFVTMGRGCLPAAMHREGKGKFVAGGPCRTECAKYAVEFRVPVPGGNGAGTHLLSLGNALYHAVPPHVSERVLARLPSLERVDRIVVTIPATERNPS
ncbi:MAG TPA: hypothetical protein PK416_02830 [Thermodesulfobacteriota bacterium]|nr:hypothetical protein [Thermodesulfobacteriota bacterium]